MKQWIILLLISSAASLSVDANASFKKIGAVATGATLAFSCHYLCEYMSTGCHELGHAGAYKLFTGKSSQIHLHKKFNPLAPWSGQTMMPDYSSLSKMRQGTTIAAGPLVGIGSTITQIHILNALEKKYITQNPPATHESVSIRGYFKNLYDEAYHTTTAFLSGEKFPDSFEDPLLIASKLLKFLRYSRIVGECLYGFAPIGVPEGVGDGQRLWSLLINRSDDGPYFTLTNRLTTITGVIMLSPILLGFFKALIK